MEGVAVFRLVWAAASLLMLGPSGRCQQTIGTVPIQDATIAGKWQVTGGQAILMGATSVTAKDHPADVALARGGTVRVCQTSGVALSSGVSGTTAPLMLALEHGAIELRMDAMANDVLLTPDLRFAVSHSGPIDLRVRVTRNGDTCVEQRGANAPMLLISDTFGEKTYEVYRNQHILFEHGSLNEVVDHESSPCGCPEPPRVTSLAEAALGASSDATVQHPFPAAESTGLAATAEIPQAPPGALHTQVAATLGYEGTDAPGAEPPPMAAPHPIADSTEGKQQRGFSHAIKHFFKRLFGRGE